MFDQNLFLDVAVGLFALLNPLLAIPIFLGLTPGYASRQRQRTALVAAITVAIALCVAALVGDQILNLFGIHAPSFQIAGGLIVLLIALRMFEDRSDEEQDAAEGQERQRNIAVYPLAIPLLAGPGAFVTTIVFSSRVGSLGDLLSLAAGIVAVVLVLWLAMAFATPAARYLNKSTINIGTRILAILLAAVAMEMIIAGIDAHFLPLFGVGEQTS
jgi:multiple antibiotic resistance protein